MCCRAFLTCVCVFVCFCSEQELLYVAEVDLVVAGHHHSYQRTCPVLKGECAMPRPNTTNGSYVAPVNVVVGMAGFASTTNIETPQPPIFQVGPPQNLNIRPAPVGWSRHMPRTCTLNLCFLNAPGTWRHQSWCTYVEMQYFKVA